MSIFYIFLFRIFCLGQPLDEAVFISYRLLANRPVTRLVSETWESNLAQKSAKYSTKMPSRFH